MGIHFVIIVVASLSLLLAWRQVYQVSREYLFFKKKVGANQSQQQS